MTEQHLGEDPQEEVYQAYVKNVDRAIKPSDVTVIIQDANERIQAVVQKDDKYKLPQYSENKKKIGDEIVTLEQ